MSVGQMCTLAEVSRAGFYRFRTTPQAGDRDLDLRDAIQRIALEFPCYGRPRMTQELRRRGWPVGHNRVARIMREDNIFLAMRRKRKSALLRVRQLFSEFLASQFCSDRWSVTDI